MTMGITCYDCTNHITTEDTPCPHCRIEKLKVALQEIVEGKGAFSSDHLTHAKNTIEHAIETAKKALESL